MPLKYSVIIPVYNAENTLHRCVDSLLAEQYAYAEIILVNDGSTDRSEEICQAYAAREKNIRYVSKENGGVSTARNAGLDIATGEYVLFVDSDDYVARDYFSTIDSICGETPADLIQFSYRDDSGNHGLDAIYSPMYVHTRKLLMPKITDAICRKTINGPVAKLYKREIIEQHHLRFPVDVSVGEDRVFNIVYTFYIQSYAVTDKIAYVVDTENEHSLTRGRHDELQHQFRITDRYFDRALAAAPLSEHEKDSYRRAANFSKCRSIYHDAKLMHQDKLNWFARQKRLGLLCNKINQQQMKYPNTRYCRLITIPVQLRLTPVIDAVAWKLAH